ncbi:MAG: TonB-dependent receptor, partial [Undibacterium sp.]|nr:TonB-dependent receptor [Undibacterium sp.]
DVGLRKPRSDRFGGQVKVGLLGTELLLEGPVTENQSFYFAAKRSHLDAIFKKDITDKDTGTVWSMPTFRDYQAKYQWKINSGNELTFHATGAADKLKFFFPKDGEFATHAPALAGNSRDEQASNTQALVWDSTINATLSNKLAVGHMDFKTKSVFGSAADVDLKQDSYFIRDQLRLRVNERHDITVGAVAFNNKVKLGLNLLDTRCTEFDNTCDLNDASRKQQQENLSVNYSNLYLKDRWQLSPDFTATVGVHFTHDGYLKRNYTEPRLGLEWQAGKDTVFNFGYGKHNEGPEGLQLLQDFGNPKLGHVQAQHMVLGVTERFSDGWSAKAEIYQKKFEGLVVGDPVLNYVNGGSGTAKGVELFVKKDVTDKLSGWLSVSLSETNRKNDVTGKEFKFEYDQPVVVNLVGNYKLNEKWSVGGKWSYHSGNLNTPIVGTSHYPDGRVRPIYGAINSERLPAYHRLDLRADWAYSERASFFFEINNAYKHQNVEGYQYSGDYSKRRVESGNDFMPNVGFQYKF